MGLNADTQELVNQGYELCEQCGDFRDFGGCYCDNPPIDMMDVEPKYPVELYASIGGQVITDSGSSDRRYS